MEETAQPEIEMIPKEQYLRLAADFENYRKRMEQEVSEIAKFGGQSVVLQVIDAFDLLEHAVSHAPPEVKGHEKWWDGLKGVDKKFQDTLKKIGVERIRTIGEKFDPNTMEAVKTVAVDDPSLNNNVHGELQAGYAMHGKIIRPAKVSVYQ